MPLTKIEDTGEKVNVGRGYDLDDSHGDTQQAILSHI